MQVNVSRGIFVTVMRVSNEFDLVNLSQCGNVSEWLRVFLIQQKVHSKIHVIRESP